MIDDEAMIEALISRKIYAIGLDVYKGEPKFTLNTLNNHRIYFASSWECYKKTRTMMADLAIDNIDEYFQKGKCKNIIN